MTRRSEMLEWNAEQIAELTRLWQDRSLSAGQIGRQMGGASRCSILGKARRLNLPMRDPSGILPGTIRAPRKPSKPKEVVMPQPEPKLAPEPSCAPVRLADAESHNCRFPLWDKDGWPDFPICGAEKATGQIYCVKHCRICFQVMPRRVA